MSKIYKSCAELIGRTPLVELCGIEKEFSLKAKIIAKAEFLNPGGSVKDRVALKMLCDAKDKGIIDESSVIIEPTSGNTGIGLAMVGSSRGYRTIIVMPDTMSVERQLLMKAYGAEVVLSDGKEGMAGAIKLAEEIRKKTPNSIIAGQFENISNPKAHYETTGKEIFEDTDGKADFFVSAVGTGGTITGTGMYLKEQIPHIKIVGVEPAGSAILSGGKAGVHKIQGIGAGFVPQVLDVSVIDEIIPVTDEDAFMLARLTAKKEGLLAGISSGASLKAAIEIAQREENAGKTIVVILPDSGSRYLTSGLYE